MGDDNITFTDKKSQNESEYVTHDFCTEIKFEQKARKREGKLSAESTLSLEVTVFLSEIYIPSFTFPESLGHFFSK